MQITKETQELATAAYFRYTNIYGVDEEFPQAHNDALINPVIQSIAEKIQLLADKQTADFAEWLSGAANYYPIEKVWIPETGTDTELINESYTSTELIDMFKEQ